MPEKKIMLPVVDISVTRREVEVPLLCPGCGADLQEEGALIHWEYQDQRRRATYLLLSGQIVWDENESPEQGDHYLSVEWRCAKCDLPLAIGEGCHEKRPVLVEQDDVQDEH